MCTTDHLEEREVSVEHVVEVDLGVVPGVVEIGQCLALVARRHDVVRDGQALRVDAVLEAAAEQVDAHDAEDEPEDEADEQHVEDGRDRLDQRVHHHLKPSFAAAAARTVRMEQVVVPGAARR